MRKPVHKAKKNDFYLDAWSGVDVESWSPTTDGGSGADVVAGSWTTDDGSGVDVGTTDGGSESLPLECDRERVCMGDLKKNNVNVNINFTCIYLLY